MTEDLRHNGALLEKHWHKAESDFLDAVYDGETADLLASRDTHPWQELTMTPEVAESWQFIDSAAELQRAGRTEVRVLCVVEPPKTHRDAVDYMEFVGMRLVEQTLALNDPLAVVYLIHAITNGTSLFGGRLLRWCMNRIGQAGVPPLLLGLQQQDLDTRLASALGLTYLPSLEALEPLIRLLSDPEPDMRAGAIDAVSYLDDPRVIPALDRALDDPGNEGMPICEIAALCLIRCGEAGEAVLRKAAECPTSRMRSGCAQMALKAKHQPEPLTCSAGEWSRYWRGK